MYSKNIIDLTILGVTFQGPVNTDRLICKIKALAPEFWQPTVDVIVLAIRRNLDLGYLRCITSENGTNRFFLSDGSRNRLDELLLADTSYQNWPTITTLEVVQFCLLNSTDAGTANIILARMKARIDKRLAEFEKCRYSIFSHGRNNSRWVALEQQRLANWNQMFSAISYSS